MPSRNRPDKPQRGRPPEDEQARARRFAPDTRRSLGRYFTPGPLVQAVLQRVRPLLPGAGEPVCVVDPACGAGAFLTEAARALPGARLFGLELDPAVARHCRERLPGAEILQGDALRGGFARLEAALPPGGFELWLGNPPYNGTSSLLKEPTAYARLRALLPADALPKGTSLRDDYAFFLLLCARRLAGRPGALALVTSASLLDAFLYAPLRSHLLQGLALREVLELGAGVFEDTKVKTCVTIFESRARWAQAPRTKPPRSPRAKSRGARYQRRGESSEALAFEPAIAFMPEAPEWIYRPADARAQALDARWRAEGEPLTQLVPVSFAGLKTRFDELLVDEDPQRLLARLRAFLAVKPGALPRFAAAHGLPPRTFGKLEALKGAVAGLAVEPARLRPFWRYAGARHRGALPASARAYCYLDRRWIPRGDHRLQGEWDPHLGAAKLIFNVRELPLAAALLTQEGCVHDHRHARFAPLHVPDAVWRAGPGAARAGGALGPAVENLSVRGRALAQRKGGALEAFRSICAFINSREVQEVWAPAFGASRELPVPVDSL